MGRHGATRHCAEVADAYAASTDAKKTQLLSSSATCCPSVLAGGPVEMVRSVKETPNMASKQCMDAACPMTFLMLISPTRKRHASVLLCNVIASKEKRNSLL